MGGLTKWQKKKKERQLPEYIPTKEEYGYYQYCVRHDIRISPIGTDVVGKWKIGISDGDNYRKIYYAPHVYDRDTIWISFYEFCKYYYDRRTI